MRNPTKDAIKNQETSQAILLGFFWEKNLKKKVTKNGLK